MGDDHTLKAIRPVFCDFIPAELEPGILYISKRYKTASHLCASGCGRKVVTPLKPTKWKLFERGVTVSLYPSIGNWSFPCRSHYWICRNEIRWAGALSEAKIRAVQSRDYLASERFSEREVGPPDGERKLQRQRSWFATMCSQVLSKLRH